jgi:hypothetical protein
MNGKGIVLGLAGIGGVALLLRAASKTTSAPAVAQQTYVDKTLAAAKTGKVAKAKAYAQKGSSEVKAAVNAIDKLLK